LKSGSPIGLIASDSWFVGICITATQVKDRLAKVRGERRAAAAAAVVRAAPEEEAEAEEAEVEEVVVEVVEEEEENAEEREEEEEQRHAAHHSSHRKKVSGCMRDVTEVHTAVYRQLPSAFLWEEKGGLDLRERSECLQYYQTYQL